MKRRSSDSSRGKKKFNHLLKRGEKKRVEKRKKRGRRVVKQKLGKKKKRGKWRGCNGLKNRGERRTSSIPEKGRGSSGD